MLPKNSFGLVFFYGAKLENSETSVYRYLQQFQEVELRRSNLQEYWNEIFVVAFASAINLAKKKGRKKLNLIIPEIGMNKYAKQFFQLEIGEEESDLYELYLNAIFKAVILSDFQNFDEVSLYFSCYDTFCKILQEIQTKK